MFSRIFRVVLGVAMMALPVYSFAQTVQKGVVKEYNERMAKTPLAGVELTVRAAGSTVSGKDGSFSLEFLTAQPGERVNVRRIEKDGYVIFNKEAVEQWNLSPTSPFVVVMCKADRFKRIRDNYYRNTEERYAVQYRKERDELARLQKEGKLKDEEYRTRLAAVSAEYERQLDNLDAYVDRFARIDLSEISAVEQEIIALVEAGRFDEAIARYEDLRIKEQLVSAIGQREKVDAAIVQLTDVKSGLEQSIDSLYASAQRQIETLRLAGGAESNRKILDIYREIADADTTNLEWLLKTGNFIREYVSDYSLALRYFATALNCALAQDGKGALSEAAVYSAMGEVFHNKGEYGKAEEYHSLALEIREKNLGTEHRYVAKTYNDLGNAAFRRGDFAKAMKYYNSALDIKEKVLGPDHPDLATTYNDLGNLLAEAGNQAKALDYYQRALEIREKALGPEHAEMAISYNNIGNVYADSGDGAKALEYYRKALAVLEKTFGPEHPDVAASYFNIGAVYAEQEEDAQAMEYYERALAIYEKLLGREHPSVANTYNNIGLLYYWQGDYGKALDYFRRASDIRERVLGAKHPDFGKSCVHIGNVYYNQDDPAQALEWYRKGLDVLLPVLGEENSLVSGVRGVILEIEAALSSSPEQRQND